MKNHDALPRARREQLPVWASRLVWLALLAWFPFAGEIHAEPRVERQNGELVLANDYLRVLVEDGALRSIEDVRTGETLLHWQAEEPVWYVEFGTRRVLPLPRGELTVSEEAGRVQVRLKTSIPPPDDVGAVHTVTVGSDPWIEMAIEVDNRSSQEIELVGFPANALYAKGRERYLVFRRLLRQNQNAGASGRTKGSQNKGAEQRRRTKAQNKGVRTIYPE